MKILHPRDFIKLLTKQEITDENESDDCDLTWTQVEDLLAAYAQVIIDSIPKEAKK